MSHARILSTLMLLAVASAWADTIHFRNGTFITVDKAVENGANLDYFMGATKYTVPRSSVERIDREQGPGISIGSTSQTNLVTVGPGPAAAPAPCACAPPRGRA